MSRGRAAFLRAERWILKKMHSSTRATPTVSLAFNMSTQKKTGGLAGIVAGQTAICTVGKEGMGLTYRGYSIEELAERAAFEEVAFLLLYGHLPNRSELENYRRKLTGLRGLPAGLKSILERL